MGTACQSPSQPPTPIPTLTPNPHPQPSPPALTPNPHPNLHPGPIQESERELKAVRRRSEDLSANLKNTVEASGARALELEGANHQLTEELLALRSQQRDTEESLHEASAELRRIKSGSAGTWLVATKCLQAAVEQLEQEMKARAAAAAEELRQARRDAAAAGEVAEAAEARAELVEAQLVEARARKGDSGAGDHVAGADPALQAENESLRQKATALQQEKAELQAELQRAVQRSTQGDAGAEQITRIAKDAAVLVGGMYEVEMELTELLEQYRVNG